MGKRFKWTVEFSVDASWVADGFELTRDRAKEMLANDLRGAYNHEISARIIAKPNRKAIRKAQGY